MVSKIPNHPFARIRLSGQTIKYIIMKKILFATLTLISILTVSCTKPDDQVLVRFQNNLDADIVDAQYNFDDTNTTSVGLLPAHSTSDYLEFNYFQIGAELPMGIMEGEVGESNIYASSGLWCGTGVEFSQLKPGKYTISITETGSEEPWHYQLLFVK